MNLNATLRWAAAILACALLIPATARAKAAGAEYSVRWDPSQGGPASAADALTALQLRITDSTDYEVQYFDVNPHDGSLPGFDAIMRKRQTRKEAQLTFKLRGASALPGKPTLKDWACPLPRPQERKDEVDLTFMSRDDVRRAYSRSCSHATRRLDIEVPAALGARPKGCASIMTRLESGSLKIEHWRMADGSALLEASRLARDTAADLGAFRDGVLAPLLAQGVKPLDRSKSSIGGSCLK